MSEGVQITRQRLHDGLCQQLTGAAMYARVISDALASRNDPAAEDAARMVELINDAVTEVQSLMSEATASEKI